MANSTDNTEVKKTVDVNAITAQRLAEKKLDEVFDSIELTQLLIIKKSIDKAIKKLENEDSITALKLLKSKGVLTNEEYNSKVSSLK